MLLFWNRDPSQLNWRLRSYGLFEPFPEEAMRQMTSHITDLHFAPTQLAYDSLFKEDIHADKISQPGNTMDALLLIPPCSIQPDLYLS